MKKDVSDKMEKLMLQKKETLVNFTGKFDSKHPPMSEDYILPW